MWKEARIVAVHKKKSKSAVENYRPISLLSIAGKIFEKILCLHITEYLNKHYLLSIKQFGFQKERSASDLLLKMVTSWNKSLDKGDDTYVVALDIAGAFDRVWHSGLVAKLESLGIEGDLLQLLGNYLQNRELTVVVNGCSSKQHKIEASVPQGSVMGPLLWNIYFDDLLQMVPESAAFADDCTLQFPCQEGKHYETICHINETLMSVASWGKRWQVSFAADKTQLMRISRRRQPDNIPNIRMDSRSLEYSASIDILGVHFDSRLTFTDHVKDLSRRAALKFACVRRLSRYLDDEGCTLIYNAQIRSIVEYASLVWSSCPPSHLQLLDKVQERMLRLVNSKRPENQPMLFQALQHRRDVSGLCALYKVQVRELPQLASLRLEKTVTRVNTREYQRRHEHEVQVPFARTELFIRSFQPHIARLWNQVIRHIDIRHFSSMHAFKSSVNKILLRYFNSSRLLAFF